MSRFPTISSYKNQVDETGTLICRNCPNPVADSRRFYCSQSCKELFFENHNWATVRYFILQRDRFTCSICQSRFSRKRLDVDHIIPVRICMDPFEKKNLRTLCKECHKKKSRLDEFALKK